MFARFDENPAMTLQDIKETKRYGRTDACTHACTDNVKTVYPTTNKVCGGYNKLGIVQFTYPGVSDYTFKKKCFFCLKIFFTFTNSEDPDEMQH